MCDSDVKSPVGRTKTIPKKKDKVKKDIKFAVFSCANYRTFPAVGDFGSQSSDMIRTIADNLKPKVSLTRTETPPGRITSTMLSILETTSMNILRVCMDLARTSVVFRSLQITS